MTSIAVTTDERHVPFLGYDEHVSTDPRTEGETILDGVFLEDGAYLPGSRIHHIYHR